MISRTCGFDSSFSSASFPSTAHRVSCPACFSKALTMLAEVGLSSATRMSMVYNFAGCASRLECVGGLLKTSVGRPTLWGGESI